MVDGKGIPLGGTITSASPAEVKLLHPLLGVTYKDTKIHRLVYDKAADSDPLRDSLLSRGIDLICPHRINRKKPQGRMVESSEGILAVRNLSGLLRALEITAVGC
ncbi:hypothetical protein [Microbulbifer epialgicus]|uniref:Transposase DDE domain-containing protein n=1 Tax=Microbulbifer epialgicus TaxID=393907 RepID=A0ABV4P2I2_9GAMM